MRLFRALWTVPVQSEPSVNIGYYQSGWRTWVTSLMYSPNHILSRILIYTVSSLSSRPHLCFYNCFLDKQSLETFSFCLQVIFISVGREGGRLKVGFTRLGFKFYINLYPFAPRKSNSFYNISTKTWDNWKFKRGKRN